LTFEEHKLTRGGSRGPQEIVDVLWMEFTWQLTPIILMNNSDIYIYSSVLYCPFFNHSKHNILPLPFPVISIGMVMFPNRKL
jgi:hypothetical protein